MCSYILARFPTYMYGVHMKTCEIQCFTTIYCMLFTVKVHSENIYMYTGVTCTAHTSIITVSLILVIN